MPNRLASEKSPYLQQHAHNPVDWYPWGEEAFAAARREDKPIFLSVGYSTCHWCHVMERESFENLAMAELLNSSFVAVKVDREERPDVDRLYMSFVQATTGGGGWPMSVWLTPGLEPFYGGTYFPPTSRWGRPGFVEVLGEIARSWREDRARIVGSAATILGRLGSLGRQAGELTDPGDEVLDAAAGHYEALFDHDHGGFGGGPKFPRPSDLLFLLREHARAGHPAAREMVLSTLRVMADGGIRDHLGGGFHRYAVDAAWRVPHFEKMLYDQAQLALVYLEAAQLTADAFFADVARDTLEYVRCDMTDPGGGLYSAEDADSLPANAPPGADKAEGAFYLWTDLEVGAVAREDADSFRLRYGMLPDGNAPSDPQGEFGRGNLLYVARSIDQIARTLEVAPSEVEAALDRARGALFHVRKQRPRPGLDDKILTGWNGLMIAAFARGARTLGAMRGGAAGETVRERYLDSARRAAGFIRGRLWEPEGRGLLRRFRDGDASVAAFAEDYAALVFGLLELWQADADPAWLEWAIVLQARMDRDFWDESAGGWFNTDGRDPSILLRLKDDYDGAEPSASALGVMNLMTLAHLTGRADHHDRVDRVFRAFARRLDESPQAMPMMLAALSARRAGHRQVVVASDGVSRESHALVAAFDARYEPFAVLIVLADRIAAARLASVVPGVAGMTARDGRPAAYVCRDFTCQAPVSTPEDLTRLL